MTAVPFRLVIPPPIRTAMLDHARREMPMECCGILAGTVRDGNGTVTGIFPLINQLQAADEFLSDPQSMLAAHKAMRRDGTDILAVYHSHPTSEPVPSRRDRERNLSPSVVTVIIGMASHVLNVRGWWLTDQGVFPAVIDD